ncbi:MAG: BON domain-containing protein [Ramlibacter sp.]|nr:BON domain-containing protein [Ramlibacter sp.]
MKPILNMTAAFAAGAIAMYCLDSTAGRRRRALMRDRVVGASHDAADYLEGKGKRIAGRARGVMATGGLDRKSSTEPDSDAQLRERVRSRMGHLVSHPRAIDVSVEDGVVRLSGSIRATELDGLLTQLTEMAGVKKVHNALTALDDPGGSDDSRIGPEAASMEPSKPQGPA